MLLDILYWIGIAAAVLIGLIVLITLVGLLFSKAHVVGRCVALKQTPETIWQTISDFANVPTWWGMVTKVQRQPDVDGQEVWRETYTGNYGILFGQPKQSPRSGWSEPLPTRKAHSAVAGNSTSHSRSKAARSRSPSMAKSPIRSSVSWRECLWILPCIWSYT